MCFYININKNIFTTYEGDWETDLFEGSTMDTCIKW
jgi:hypothetical protein